MTINTMQDNRQGAGADFLEESCGQSGEQAGSQALECTLETTPCCPEDAGDQPEKVQGFLEGGVQQPFAGGLQIQASPDYDSAGEEIC